MNKKNIAPSLLDSHQMSNLMFDEEHHAQRVVIVNDSSFSGPREAQPIQPQQPPITIKEYITVPQIERIEVPVIVKEIERIEVPVFQDKIQIVYVDKIVPVHETKIIEIERPIVVRQVEYRDIASKDLFKVMYCLAAMQAFSILVQLAFHFLKS